jgi:ABC-type sugar transport system ATPase subunit
MADRIAVLNDGEIIQIGTPEDIYDRPATTFVSLLVGSPHINLMATEGQNGNMFVKTASCSFRYLLALKHRLFSCWVFDLKTFDPTLREHM